MFIDSDIPRRRLRQSIDDLLKADSELDAFCMDYFPHIEKMFSNGMDRIAKVNLLIKSVDKSELIRSLEALHKERGALVAGSPTREKPTLSISPARSNLDGRTAVTRNPNSGSGFFHRHMRLVFSGGLGVVSLAIGSFMFLKVPACVIQGEKEFPVDVGHGQINELDPAGPDMPLIESKMIKKRPDIKSSRSSINSERLAISCTILTSIPARIFQDIQTCLPKEITPDSACSKHRRDFSFLLRRIGLNYYVAGVSPGIFPTSISECMKPVLSANEGSQGAQSLPLDISVRCSCE